MDKREVIFSFVLPAYNRAGLVGLTMDSILANRDVSLEVIVVDDGSTDNTSDVVGAFPPEIVKYVRTANRERGAARNTGLRMSSGIYVNYFDSDDLLMTTLGELAAFAEKKGWPSVLYGDIQHVDSLGNIIPNTLFPYRDFTSNLLHNNFLACGSVFIKRSEALKFPFHEDRRLSSAEDWELWLRVRTKYEFVHFPKPVFRQVHHTGRSLRMIDPARVEERDVYFAGLVKSNRMLLEYYGDSAINLFVADRYSFIALCWLPANKVRSFQFWRKAAMASWSVLGRRRFWAVLKNLLLK